MASYSKLPGNRVEALVLCLEGVPVQEGLGGWDVSTPVDGGVEGALAGIRLCQGVASWF